MRYFTKLLFSLGMFFNVVFYNPGILAQRPSDKFERRVFHSENDSIQYRLFVPELIDSTTDLFPLIMTLHGSGEIGNDNYKHIIYNRIAETWAEDWAQKENPTFVFSPQIPAQSQDLGFYIHNYWAPTVSLILDSLLDEFPIDTSRIYVTGLSIGAMNTWGFIYGNELNRFAAAIPMSGGWVPIDLEPQITNIPVWTFCGVYDELLSDVRDMVSIIEDSGYTFTRISSQYGNIGLTIDQIDSLNQNDHRHIYTEYTDMGHVIWDKTYDDPVLHHWLFSQKKDFTTNIDQESQKNLPNEYNLSQNYPNPFNPSTTIKYSIPSTVNANEVKQSNEIATSISSPRKDVANVTLKVYDILGREVSTLVNQKQKPGNYEVNWDASNESSGVYFYKLTVGSFIETKKMILLR